MKFLELIGLSQLFVWKIGLCQSFGFGFCQSLTGTSETGSPFLWNLNFFWYVLLQFVHVKPYVIFFVRQNNPNPFPALVREILSGEKSTHCLNACSWSKSLARGTTGTVVQEQYLELLWRNLLLCYWASLTNFQTNEWEEEVFKQDESFQQSHL